MAYLDSTCVVGFELNNGLSTAGYFDLVLRAEPRHDYIVPQSVLLYTWQYVYISLWRRTFDCVGAPVVRLLAVAAPHPSSAVSVEQLLTT